MKIEWRQVGKDSPRPYWVYVAYVPGCKWLYETIGMVKFRGNRWNWFVHVKEHNTNRLTPLMQQGVTPELVHAKGTVEKLVETLFPKGSQNDVATETA